MNAALRKEKYHYHSW